MLIMFIKDNKMPSVSPVVQTISDTGILMRAVRIG